MSRSLARAAESNGFPKLQTLTLQGRQLSDIGVAALARAAELHGFPQLQILAIRGKDVGDVGVEALAHAAESHGFPELKTLILEHTQVSNMGVAALAQTAEAGHFPQLQDLGLEGTKVAVAAEELGNPRSAANISRAKRQLRSPRRKWWCLASPKPESRGSANDFFSMMIPSGRRETHDIELIGPHWKPRVGNLDVSLKVWDFGGHHVLHGTHEMFLTRRSLAILVLDVTRSLQSNRAEYWLKLLRYCAGSDTPSIILVTKCDDEFPIVIHRIGNVDPPDLQYDLAQVPQVVQCFSALEPLPKPGHPEPVAIGALKSAIVTAVQQIEDIHKTVSPESARMKRRVEREIKGRALVSLLEYRDWCREEGVDDPDQSILRTLHNFGSVFFFGHTVREIRLALDDTWLDQLPPGERRLLTARRDSILEKWIVNPHWLKWPIYEVIRQSADSQRTQNGVMTFEDIVEFARQGARIRAWKCHCLMVLYMSARCWS